MNPWSLEYEQLLKQVCEGQVQATRQFVRWSIDLRVRKDSLTNSRHPETFSLEPLESSLLMVEFGWPIDEVLPGNLDMLARLAELARYELPEDITRLWALATERYWLLPEFKRVADAPPGPGPYMVARGETGPIHFDVLHQDGHWHWRGATQPVGNADIYAPMEAKP